jgi:parallel beta helix pectate lyase-like protein
MSKRQRRRAEKRRRHVEDQRPNRGGRQLATGAGVTVGATLLMGGAAQAATLTVGSTADTSTATDCAVATNTDCTLRDAIDDANLDPGSTISFRSGLSGTITLGSALPSITVPMTINGPGAGQITVSGDDAYRPFYVNTPTGDDVSISGLTIANGSGGGIYSSGADLTLTELIVRDNANGSGVGASGGSLTIANSTISGNSGTRGSGVYTDSASGTPATVRNSTISGNHDADYGGGIYFDYSSPATLDNSTVYGNSADGSGGGVYHFGAYNGDPGLVVTGSTITHNTAYRGGGLACYASTNNGNDLTEPIVRNTIIFGNTADSADLGPDLSCSFPTGATEPPGVVPIGFSLVGSVAPSTQLNQTGPNLLGQDPQLGPLASNGGPTQTQKPALASPVIDQGAAFGLGSDQRGLGRPVEIPTIPNAAGGDGSDIGAVELQPSELPSNSFTAKVKGKKILVTVAAAGSIGVADAKAPLSASAAKKKKKRKLFLKASSGSGGPPTITVALRLTKLAKQKLRQKGKLALKSRITFTPNRGIPNTKKIKLKIKGKKRKK